MFTLAHVIFNLNFLNLLFKIIIILSKFYFILCLVFLKVQPFFYLMLMEH